MAKGNVTASKGSVKTADKAEEKASKKRIKHPLVGAKTGYPFQTPPADFDFTKHKGLKKSDFDGKLGFAKFKVMELEFQKGKLDKKLADARATAERIEKFGDDKADKKAKKLAKMKAA